MVIVASSGRGSYATHYAEERLGLVSTLCGRPNRRHTGKIAPSSGPVTCRHCLRLHAGRVGAPRITPRLRALVRADLARVARLTGLPEGVGPSVDVYRAHGSLGCAKVRGLVSGYTRDNPRASWTEALRYFGLRPQGMNGSGLITREAIIEDVRRVGGFLKRRPSRSEYERLGRYSPPTVYRYLGGGERKPGKWGSWVAAMREVFPDPEARGLVNDADLRRMHEAVSAPGPLKWERHRATRASTWARERAARRRECAA